MGEKGLSTIGITKGAWNRCCKVVQYGSRNSFLCRPWHWEGFRLKAELASDMLEHYFQSSCEKIENMVKNCDGTGWRRAASINPTQHHSCIFCRHQFIRHMDSENI